MNCAHGAIARARIHLRLLWHALDVGLCGGGLARCAGGDIGRPIPNYNRRLQTVRNSQMPSSSSPGIARRDSLETCKRRRTGVLGLRTRSRLRRSIKYSVSLEQQHLLLAQGWEVAAATCSSYPADFDGDAIRTVAVIPATRRTFRGTSSMHTCTGMRCASLTQVKMGLTAASPC
jgi:hypothetical protein